MQEHHGLNARGAVGCRARACCSQHHVCLRCHRVITCTGKHSSPRGKAQGQASALRPERSVLQLTPRPCGSTLSQTTLRELCVHVLEPTPQRVPEPHVLEVHHGMA
jgi:alkylated DNA nucleotide flippase Atl1